MFEHSSRFHLPQGRQDKGERLFAARNLLSYLATDNITTWEAHQMRETALNMLPEMLSDFNLNELAIDQLATAYMMCSYGYSPHKHRIKPVINELFRKEMKEFNIREWIPNQHVARKKPVCLVVTNWFNPSHVMYRCFANSIEAIKKHFTLINFAVTNYVIHNDLLKIFERIIVAPVKPLPDFLDNIKKMAEVILSIAEPDVILYADIAMHPCSIFLSNLRLAPLQVSIAGHPTSSYSKFIDGYIIDENLVHTCKDFTEKVYGAPSDAYTITLPKVKPIRRESRKHPKILIPATNPKITPPFLMSCKEIACELRAEVHLTTNASDKHYPIMKKNIEQLWGQPSHEDVLFVHPNHEYMEVIADCDMYLMTWPFAGGNMTVDCLSQGLVGVCMEGEELHEASAAFTMSKILGYRDDHYIAKKEDEYFDKAIALGLDHVQRQGMRNELCSLFDDEKRLKQHELFEKVSDGYAKVLFDIYNKSLDNPAYRL